MIQLGIAPPPPHGFMWVLGSRYVISHCLGSQRALMCLGMGQGEISHNVGSHSCVGGLDTVWCVGRVSCW